MDSSLQSAAEDRTHVLLNSIFEGMATMQSQIVALTASNKAMDMKIEKRLQELETRLTECQAKDVKLLLSRISDIASRDNSATRTENPRPILRRASAISSLAASRRVSREMVRATEARPPTLRNTPVKRSQTLATNGDNISSSQRPKLDLVESNNDVVPFSESNVSSSEETLTELKKENVPDDRTGTAEFKRACHWQVAVVSPEPQGNSAAFDVTDFATDIETKSQRPSDVPHSDMESQISGNNFAKSNGSGQESPTSQRRVATLTSENRRRPEQLTLTAAPTTPGPIGSSRPSVTASGQSSFKALAVNDAYKPSYGVMFFREDLQPKTPSCFGLRRPGSTFDALLLRFLRSIFGISDPDIWTGNSGSRVIHPTSPFGAGLELTSAFFVVYCIAAVPVQLSFWNEYWPCRPVPTLEVDMVIDVFFMMEIMLRFFVGIEIKGRYCDRLGPIAWAYLTKVDGFFFDAATSIPFSLIAWDVLQHCNLGESNTGFDQNASILRTVKTLRIMRLSRLLRTFKLFSAYLQRLDINPTTVRIFKLFFVLVSAMHIFSCAFWRVKLETNQPEQLTAWLIEKNVDPEETAGMYVACLYFVCTVFFTVGFGDISATNFGERIFCIFLMAFAACVFGLILGELQEIYAAANTKNRELDDHMDSVVSFLQQNSVPKLIEVRIKNWIRFHYPQNRADLQNREIMDTLPPVLRQTLACNMNKGLFSKVVLWSCISNAGSLKDEFTAELLLRMHTGFFVADSPVASNREVADRLMVIVSGTVSIYEPGRSPDPAARLITLGPGGSIGDNALLGDERWGGIYGIDADFIADDNCKMCYFYTSDIMEVINSSPSYLMIRRLVERLKFQPDDNPDDDIEYLEDPATSPSLPRWTMDPDVSRRSFQASPSRPRAPSLACAVPQTRTTDRAADEDTDHNDPGKNLGGKIKLRCVFNWIRVARTLLHTEPSSSSAGGRGEVLKHVFKQWLGPE